MIPAAVFAPEQDFEIIQYPGHTFKLDINKARITGFTDGIEAVKQTVYLILNIERYRHVIYSWKYGIELEDLFGKPKSYVYPELKRRITEALLQDDRITGVDGFVFEKAEKRNTVLVRFTVHTVYGDFAAEREVSV
jgi:hypothetical protein